MIGNPPWASATKSTGFIRGRGHRCPHREGRCRRTPTLRPCLMGMDLPFVWRALQWGEPGGQIAFALHGRLLFQRGWDGPARSALLRALDVSGILNGANSAVALSGTKFCTLLSPVRSQSVSASRLRFPLCQPPCEDRLNGAGAMRVDAANAAWVTPRQVAERPEILKILYRGALSI